jgi:UDPglucose 6-dehydrogenase
VESAVGTLKGEKVVVLRSTIPLGTTESLQKKFPNHHFLFNPEFLRAATAYEDFLRPPRQLIGFTSKSEKYAKEVLSLLPAAPAEYTKILPATAAELVKYAANTILASKVAIANKIFDFAKVLNVDYDEIKKLIAADPRIGSYGLEVMYEGFRGYNGTCFPKDVRSLVALGGKLGVDVKWLRDMDDENIRLLKSQGQEPDYGYPKTPIK